MSKDYILRSHERSKNYNVVYDQVYSKKIIEGKELFHKLDANRELVLAAAPIMNKIYDFVKGSNFFSILTDKEGCILNVIGDEDILSEAFSFKMIPGAYMDEENIGTNAMGMALVEKTPLQLSGKDHYVNAYHRWTCSSSPIKDTTGNVIGVLDLTGYSESVHSHTLGMVVSAAYAIEKVLETNEFELKLKKEKDYFEAIQNSYMSGVIVTDMSGKIITANSIAYDFFGYSQDELNHMNIGKIIKDWDLIFNLIAKQADSFDEDVDVYSKKNLQQLNLHGLIIKNQKNEDTNIILMFSEVKKQRKLANKIMKGQAIYTFDKIISQDENFLEIINFAKKVSNSRSNILILGESGTGKELFAQSIHNYSNRANESFVALNCAAIPRDLIESELFGYDEGAFSGAKKSGNPGKFEIADKGTIFLDEIGEMPYDLQTRLLRVIEEGTVSRIGSSKNKVVDVRVIAATNKDLKEAVESGTFRKDLYYRLNVLPIRLSNLNERKGDIKLLVEYFMEKISKKLNKKKLYISETDIEKLTMYDWPGNVRELENYIELIINAEKILDINNYNNNISPGKVEYHEETKEDMSETQFLSLKEAEREHILKVLNGNEYNITRTAKILGIGRNTLYRKLKELNIDC